MDSSSRISLPNALEDLKLVETPYGFNASSDKLYSYAEFGRDARQLAADALVFNPDIAHKIVLSLVRRQAWSRYDYSEAQKGKFHHEHRQLVIDNQPIPDYSQKILVELAAKWGGSSSQVTYYGSSDVTPDTISLIAEYAKIQPNILHEKVENQERQRLISVKESARAGVQWLTNTVLYGPTVAPRIDLGQKVLTSLGLTRFIPPYHNRVLETFNVLQRKTVKPILNKQRIKLFEFQRANPSHGHVFQNWMDGGTSFIHSQGPLSGVLADYTQPIATIEMQSSAFDAFIKASFLFPNKERVFKRLAYEIRQNVFKYFWMEDKQYFAMGVDRDTKGRLRPITTLAANAAEILNSSFFDDLSEEEKKYYISSLAAMLFSDEFLTDAGIRTRAKSHASVSGNLWDYQGSETSWIVQTGRIAEGLRHQKLFRLADQLDNRILNTVNIAGFNLEFVYVGAQGTLENIVGYNVQNKQNAPLDLLHQATQPRVVEIAATNIPERTQTWTASRVAAIKHRREHEQIQPTTQKNSWQNTLEETILSSLRQRNAFIEVITDIPTIAEVRSTTPLFLVNIDQGRKLTQQLVEKSEEYHKRAKKKEKSFSLRDRLQKEQLFPLPYFS